MTAIITKQNAIDKAFIAAEPVYPTDAVFDTIKVNKEATFTVDSKDITFSGSYNNTQASLTNHESRIATLEQSKPVYPTDATFNTIKVSNGATFTVDKQDITFANHESRIQTLEKSGGGGDSSFQLESGYPEIIITKNLTETDDVNTHTLTINIDKTLYKGYVGDMVEFTLPNEMIADLTTAGVTQDVKISQQDNNTYIGWTINMHNLDV